MTATDATRLVQKNRRAYHEYHVLDTIECGLVLVGTEVKSVREGGSSIKEAYGRILDGEAYLFNMTIAAYDKARENHDSRRKRKLLLHAQELRKVSQKLRERGFTWIPISLHFRRGMLKVVMGLCRGKRLHDKRDKMKQDDARRDMERFSRD